MWCDIISANSSTIPVDQGICHVNVSVFSTISLDPCYVLYFYVCIFEHAFMYICMYVCMYWYFIIDAALRELIQYHRDNGALRQQRLFLHQPPDHRVGVSHVDRGHPDHLRLVLGVRGGHLEGAAAAHHGGDAQGGAAAVPRHLRRGQLHPAESAARIQRGRGRAAQQRQAHRPGLEVQPPPPRHAVGPFHRRQAAATADLIRDGCTNIIGCHLHSAQLISYSMNILYL